MCENHHAIFYYTQPPVFVTKIFFLLFSAGVITIAAFDSTLYYSNLTGYLFIFIVLGFLAKGAISRQPFNDDPTMVEILFLAWCVAAIASQIFFLKQLNASVLMTICTGLLVVTCTKEWAGSMLSGIFAATLLLCTYFLAQYYYNLLVFKRADDVVGIFYNSGPFSIFVSLFWPIALIRYHRGDKILAAAYFGLTAILLSITISRTSIAIAFLSTAAFFAGRLKVKEIAAVAAVLVSSAVFLLWLKPASVIGRLCVWKVTSSLFLKNLLLGVGISNFANTYNAYKATIADESCSEYLDKVDYPFNELIRIFIEGGIVSGVFLITIALYIFYSLARRKGRYNGKLAIAAAIIPPILFSYPLSLPLLSLIIVCYIVLLKPAAAVTKIPLPSRKKLSCGILLLLVLVSLLFPVLKQFREEIYLSKFLHDYSKSEIPRSVVFEKHAHLQEHPIFAVHYGKHLVNTKRYQEAVIVNSAAARQISDPMLLCTLAEALTSTAQTTEAETTLQRAILMAPKRIYPRFQLFKLYLATGDNEKARDVGDLILTRTKNSRNIAAIEMRRFVLTHLQ